MVSLETRGRVGTRGCTKPLFSAVLRQIMIDSAVLQLLFGCCTLVPGIHGFRVYSLMEIPPVRLE